jgi:sulfatase modifying factor 1
MPMSFACLPRLCSSFGVAALVVALAGSTHAITIDWVTVGDAGNAADTAPAGYGAVSEAFRIMKYEYTNQQYVDFLNSVATVSDPYTLYAPTAQGGDARCGVIRSGASGSYTYAVKANMGDKPVNAVSWFDAARVCNWLQNGATGTSSTETGAYTLNGVTTGSATPLNLNATYSLPTENQWYKAAYYKGGGTNAGYWNYATQSDTIPGKVTSGTTGVGSRPAGTGNFANFGLSADWNSFDGNVTTVGTNGGPSAYGAYDMTGNLREWTNDGTNQAVWTRGGAWDSADNLISSEFSRSNLPSVSTVNTLGFRIVSVPEPSTCVMALAGLACGGYSLVWRRRARPGYTRPAHQGSRSN